MTIMRRALGSSRIHVSALGLGAGPLGDPTLSERDAEAILERALALDINLFDTARSYGPSEERIGRALGARRREVVLSTKIGYGIEGFADWTGPCIGAGVDAALKRLRTDVIDVVHLHSPPREILERRDVIEALLDAVQHGKVRVAGYSGDNEALAFAVASGAFGCIETSLNLCDQRSAATIARAREVGIGVIAKRPLANAPWRFPERPVGQDPEEYWVRFRALGLDASGMPWDELALRFSAWHEGVSSAIVGTRDIGHLAHDAEIVAKGPLPAEVVGRIREAFLRHGGAWAGRV